MGSYLPDGTDSGTLVSLRSGKAVIDPPIYLSTYMKHDFLLWDLIYQTSVNSSSTLHLVFMTRLTSLGSVAARSLPVFDFGSACVFHSIWRRSPTCRQGVRRMEVPSADAVQSADPHCFRILVVVSSWDAQPTNILQPTWAQHHACGS